MSNKVAREDYFEHLQSNGSPGQLRTSTRVSVVDIFGRSITRKVSLGSDYNTSLGTAKDTVQKVRENNPGIEITAEYRVSL